MTCNQTSKCEENSVKSSVNSVKSTLHFKICNYLICMHLHDTIVEFQIFVNLMSKDLIETNTEYEQA